MTVRSGDVPMRGLAERDSEPQSTPPRPPASLFQCCGYIIPFRDCSRCILYPGHSILLWYCRCFIPLRIAAAYVTDVTVMAGDVTVRPGRNSLRDVTVQLFHSDFSAFDTLRRTASASWKKVPPLSFSPSLFFSLSPSLIFKPELFFSLVFIKIHPCIYKTHKVYL